ncbi:MAG: hypothetical protein SNJ75_10360 [Gemmataceae bacterium]
MRKPRSPIKVDTFPFLAVLLCAMGALIVVLLVMDRKAKQVARQKAQQQIQTQQSQRQQTSVEWEADRLKREAAALVEWQRKRDEYKRRVDLEQARLEAELQAARQRAIDSTRLLEKESVRLESARTKLAKEVQALQQLEKQLAEADKAQAAASQRLQAVELARNRTATQIQSLERSVAEAKRTPISNGKTFSLIPYGGKRGANSRPVYAECSGDGVFFHPEKKKIAATQTQELRREAIHRLESRGEDAYLMILLRPDGIDAYYALRKAVDDLEITFGYEMIDADWQLDFSREPTASPKELALPGSPRMQGPGRLAEANSTPSGPGPVGNLAELPPLDTTESPERAMLGKPSTRPPGPLGLPTLSPPLVLGAPQPRRPSVDSSPGYPSMKAESTPPNPDPSISKAESPPPSASEQGPHLEGLPSPKRIKPKQPAATKEPLRPVRLESDEITVFVECYPEYVVVYPSKKSFGAAAFRNGSFVTQVKQGLSRPLLGGGTPKPQIRFLIRPGGERMLHLALDNLRGLRVPMTQYTIQPEDDVQKIVSQR